MQLNSSRLSHFVCQTFLASPVTAAAPVDAMATNIHHPSLAVFKCPVLYSFCFESMDGRLFSIQTSSQYVKLIDFEWYCKLWPFYIVFTTIQSMYNTLFYNFLSACTLSIHFSIATLYNTIKFQHTHNRKCNNNCGCSSPYCFWSDNIGAKWDY